MLTECRSVSKISSIARASAAAIIMFGSNVASADNDPCPEPLDLCVSAPFNSTTAIENLKKCVKVEDGDAEKLSRIQQIKYIFDPPNGIFDSTTNSSSQGEKPIDRSKPVEPDDRQVLLERHTKLTTTAIGSSTIYRVLDSLRGGDCEKDTKIWSTSVSLLSINRISVKYSTEVDIRDCGHILGIPYKNDVGSGGGDVNLVYRITDDFSLVEESHVVLNEWKKHNWTYDVLPFVLPGLGTFGIVLAFELKSLLNHASAAPGGGAIASEFTNDFQALAAGVSTATQFAQDVDLLHAPFWKFERVPQSTGLIELGSDTSTFQLVERVMIPPQFGARAHGMKVAEIKAINELRFPRPRIHDVARGENLWKIASIYYAEPKMFALIESASNLRRQSLRPGQQLIVPFYTELCEQNNEGRVVRPGDTVWALMQKHFGYKPKRQEFRSRRLNLIYPFETVRLPNTATASPQQ